MSLGAGNPFMSAGAFNVLGPVVGGSASAASAPADPTTMSFFEMLLRRGEGLLESAKEKARGQLDQMKQAFESDNPAKDFDKLFENIALGLGAVADAQVQAEMTPDEIIQIRRSHPGFRPQSNFAFQALARRGLR